MLPAVNDSFVCSQRRLVRALLLVPMLGALPGFVQAQTPAPNVLVLSSSERPFGPQSKFAESLKPDIIRRSQTPIDFVEMTIQPTRSNAPAPDAEFARRVHDAFEKQPLDLVITVGGPAAAFAQQFRQQLFPATPMLFAGVDQRFLETATFTRYETAVATQHEPAPMIDAILTLLPDTRTVMVVIGSSPTEKFWLSDMQREFRRFAGRVQFVWTNQLGLAEIIEASKTLPANAAIFFAVLSIDGKGEPVIADHALSALHAAANAPIFGLYDAALGKGIVGGPLLTSGELSAAAADVAIRILGGESPGAIKLPIQHATRSTFDARELARWNIAEARLPPGSVLKFRELPFWQRHRTAVVAGGVILGVQLIAGAFLLAAIVRRRRHASAAVMGDGPLTPVPPNATVVMWTASADGRRGQAGSGQEDGWIASIHPEDLERSLETYRRAYARREPFQMEYRIRDADGAERWILDTGLPNSSGGVFEGFIGTAVDVTGLGRDRAELSSLSRHLMREHEHERAAVSKAIHEDVGQRIGALTMQLHSLKGGAKDDQMRRVVDEISEQLGALAGDIVTVSDPLYQKIEVLGLTAASRGLCQDLSGQYEIPIHFQHEHMPADLPTEVAVAIFRVLQEAAVNAVKHSASLDIWVSLRGAPTEVRLEVLDSGIGFDMQRDLRGDCVGLVGIRERLKLVNGGSAVESRPGEGTRIVAWVPLPA
jgi:signal transduction histidine kinase